MVAKRNWKKEPKGQRTISKVLKFTAFKILHFVKQFHDTQGLTQCVSMLGVNRIQYPNNFSIPLLRVSRLGFYLRVASERMLKLNIVSFLAFKNWASCLYGCNSVLVDYEVDSRNWKYFLRGKTFSVVTQFWDLAPWLLWGEAEM